MSLLALKLNLPWSRHPSGMKTRGGQRVGPWEPCARDQPRPLPHSPTGTQRLSAGGDLSHLGKVHLLLLLNAFRRTHLREPTWCPHQDVGSGPQVAHLRGGPELSPPSPGEERRRGRPHPASGVQWVVGATPMGNTTLLIKKPPPAPH